MKIIVLTSIYTCIAFFLSGQSATSYEDTLMQFSLDEVVVSGSRISEKLLASPVSISKLDTRQIRRAAAPSFFGALGNMKGVQMLVPSMGFRVLLYHVDCPFLGPTYFWCSLADTACGLNPQVKKSGSS